MALYFHIPHGVNFRRFTRHTHLISSLPGEAGTAELLAFGAMVGLKAEWLQERGTEKEHFDVFDSVIVRIRDAGANEVGSRDFCVLGLWAKRDAMKGSTP